MSFHKKLSQKIVSKDKLNTLLQEWNKHSQQIVFTNGCFDILHRGHV